VRSTINIDALQKGLEKLTQEMKTNFLHLDFSNEIVLSGERQRIILAKNYELAYRQAGEINVPDERRF